MPHITSAHLHVLINHIPIIGFPIIALLLLWGLLRHQDDVIRAALLASVVIAIGTWATDLTGDGAKDDIRNTAWYNRDIMRAHEDAADWSNITGIVAGLAAIGTLILARRGRPVKRSLAWGVFALLILGSTTAGWAGYDGGKIRHDEFGLSPGVVPRAE